jgi:hypothetical protein
MQKPNKMKIAPFILIILLSTIVACTKKSVEKPDVPIVDGIIYTELDPLIHLSSVDTLIAHGSGCGNIPSPADSITSISFDINNDDTLDFTLSCKSWYYFVSASSPCANYHTSIYLSGTAEEHKVGITEPFNSVKRYLPDEVIDASQNWSNPAMLMLSSATAPFSTNFNDTAYVGLKIHTDQGDYFGWIYFDKQGYDLTVISYAVHQTVNSPIRAGQTE